MATLQNEMTWNGREWVQSQSPMASTTFSTYTAVVTPHQTPSSDPVALYTQYYHNWKRKETDEEQRALNLYGEAQQEAKRQAAWAKYYADQSSRAAHYFHNPQGPAPELPPAPPQSLIAPAAPAARTQPVVKQTQPSQQPKQQLSKSESPGGLKEYVHRCLSQCKGKDELQKMQDQVQQVITKAVKDGNLHTIDWHAKALIPMPGEVQQISIQSGPSADDGVRYCNDYTVATPQPSSVARNNGHYGASVASTRSTSANAATENYSYYGNNVGLKSDRISDYSYYGNNTERKSGEMGDDYIVLSKKLSKNQQKKANKLSLRQESETLKRKAADGFERSNGTLEKRANRFSGAGGIYEASTTSTTVERNIDKYMGKGLIGGSKKLDEDDYENMKVKGTCQTLEKEYLRLTAPPKAERVRPQPILERHLQNLINERDSSKRRDYLWFCSQFKAIRQDLTVQRIFNAFAVRVYETHARVALEEKDLNEYNQCQTQLKELYTSLHDDEEALANVNEFIAYRIIYYVFLTGNKKYDGGSGDLFKIMLSLSPEQRLDAKIAHSLKVRSAVAEFDYHSFFRLQNTCPVRSMVYLMDFLVPTVRQWSLQRICKAYRPSVPVGFVLSELGFDEEDFELGSKWLESCGCVLSDDRQTLEAKDTVVHESDWKEQNSLI